MNPFVKTTIAQSKIDPEKAKRLKEANDALAEIRREIEEEFKSSAQYSMIKALAKQGREPHITWNSHGGFDVSYELLRDYAAQAKAKPHDPLYLGESTINTLLAGKLLSDDEKRMLVERVTQGALALTKKKAQS